MRCRRHLFAPLFGLCAALALPPPAAAGDGDDAYKKSQPFRGITQRHVVTDVAHGDLDGDGRGEVLVAFREPEDAVDQRGGVLVLSPSADGYRVAWCAMFDKVFPRKVALKGGGLQLDLVRKTATGDQQTPKLLERGKDFFLRGDPGGPFDGLEIKASSTLKGGGAAAANVFDGDLKTSWAEGADGTGVDESITLTFKKPVHLALIGVLHGDFRGKRQWVDSNRIHRAEVTVETAQDRYDADSDVDLGEDLGLGLYGDRVELSFTNQPVMRYFTVDKRNITSLELKITSVLLGEKNDDTYLAEIDLVELLPVSVLLGPQAEDKPAEKKSGAKPEAKAEDWTEDDF
ncbi:MAG TPA: hypothetical protein PK668_05590 [Myxococcota bacterium]|nr:hypothetical protein [Myxococcota bacterium]HRY92687.1 hypothetical protein [Myxococcota bacterium]